MYACLNAACLAIAGTFASAALPVKITTEVTCHSELLAMHGSAWHASCEAVRVQKDIQMGDLRTILILNNDNVSVTGFLKACLASHSCDIAPVVLAEAVEDFPGPQQELIHEQESLASVVVDQSMSSLPLNSCTNFFAYAANFISERNMSRSTPGSYSRLIPSRCSTGSFRSLSSELIYDRRILVLCFLLYLYVNYILW